MSDARSHIAIKSPLQCLPNEIDQFCNLVAEGGEVQFRGLPNLVRKAEVLAFLTVDNKLAGTAGLKNPNAKHKRDVFERSRSIDLLADYPLELGWVCVSKEFQGSGHSKALLKELLPSAKDRGVYSTSITDNHRMHRALKRGGFVQIGDSWPSTNQPGKSLFLFVRH